MKKDHMSHIFSYHLNVLLISVPNFEMSRHGSPNEKVYSDQKTTKCPKQWASSIYTHPIDLKTCMI